MSRCRNMGGVDGHVWDVALTADRLLAKKLWPRCTICGKIGYEAVNKLQQEQKAEQKAAKALKRVLLLDRKRRVPRMQAWPKGLVAESDPRYRDAISTRNLSRYGHDTND